MMNTRRLCFLVLFFVLAGCAPKPEPEITDYEAAKTREAIELATIEAWPTPDITAGVATHEARLTEEAPTPEPTASATLEPTATPIPKRYTAVLLGEDHFGTGMGSRTDIFIILTYIPFYNDLLIISVPRDLYVEYGGQARILCPIPGEPISPLPFHDRINRAYAFGGFDCVGAVVEHNFGLVVNSGIAITGFKDFAEIVDHMDGLSITPIQNYSCHVKSLDAGGFEYWAIWRVGSTYQMNGEQLLCYVRERMISGGIDRDRRAQEVLLAMKDQWFDAQPINAIFNLMPFMLERVSIDIGIDTIDSLIQLVKGEASENVSIRKVIFSYDQEVTPHITEDYGAWVFLPLVDLQGWTDCLLSGHSAEVCAYANNLVNLEEWGDD